MPFDDNSSKPGQFQTPSWSIWLGLFIIYIVWSSTYLAIRFAVETIPPFIMASGRFLVAGCLLYFYRRLAGDPKPSKIEWRSASLIGAFLLIGGNGGVSFAEQRVVSGIAALIVGATPLWIIVVDFFRPGSKKPGWLSVSGVIIGFFGVLFLFNPWTVSGHSQQAINVDFFGLVILLLASLSWAIGSVYSREVTLPKSPLLATGMEMIAGGLGLFLLSIVVGEWNKFEPALVISRSWYALFYLIFIGAILGFATYTWLLSVAPVSLVSTYAYVNPLIAIALGSIFAAEPITPQLLFSSILIIGSVVFITIANKRMSPMKKKTIV